MNWRLHSQSQWQNWHYKWYDKQDYHDLSPNHCTNFTAKYSKWTEDYIDNPSTIDNTDIMNYMTSKIIMDLILIPSIMRALLNCLCCSSFLMMDCSSCLIILQVSFILTNLFIHLLWLAFSLVYSTIGLLQRVTPNSTCHSNKHFYSQVKLKRLKLGKLVTKILTESLQESPSHCTNSTVSPAWASPPPQRWSLAPVQSYCKFLSFWKACSFICCSYPPLISDLCSLSDGLFLIDQNLCLFLYCCSSFQRPCCRMDWN